MGLSQDVTPSLQSEMKSAENEVKTERSAKNVLASGFLTGLTAIVVYLFKHYNDKLLSFVEAVANVHK